MFPLFLVLMFAGIVPSYWAQAETITVVKGRNFEIPATQQIRFVPLVGTDPALLADKNLPRLIDLRSIQSKVKHQGTRGACSYFTITSLAESLIKRTTGREVDISEEYLAWAAKTKAKMRSMEEDSSIAVNAATLQEFGFMLEEDLPYQPSWFNKGFPCEGQAGNSNIDPACYSHLGPSAEKSKQIIEGKNFVFEAVDSGSRDLVLSLAYHQAPVAVSILGHRDMWDQTQKTGELSLAKRWKEECQASPKLCSGHVTLIVGYDLDKRVFLLKNSWGTEWGNEGYGTIPFDYIDQMSPRKFLTGSLVGKFKLP